MVSESATIIIPVHNGEIVIGETLASILTQECKYQFLVILICNGCRDDSVSVARSWINQFSGKGHKLVVHEIQTGSRSISFNMADEMATGVRIYLDQDAVLSITAIQKLIEALSSGYHYATLRPSLRNCPSTLVRLYYKFWVSIPYVQTSPASMGLYAVSVEGRNRWHKFPKIHSDDKFVRLHFQQHERIRINTETYSVNPPQSLMEMISARIRYDVGNKEIKTFYKELADNDIVRHKGILSSFWHVSLLIPAVIFVAVLVSTRILIVWRGFVNPSVPTR